MSTEDQRQGDYRQALCARVWGSEYRTWWWNPGGRHKKEAKRRSAKRERAAAKRWDS